MFVHVCACVRACVLLMLTLCYVIKYVQYISLIVCRDDAFNVPLVSYICQSVPFFPTSLQSPSPSQSPSFTVGGELCIRYFCTSPNTVSAQQAVSPAFHQSVWEFGSLCKLSLVQLQPITCPCTFLTLPNIR